MSGRRWAVVLPSGDAEPVRFCTDDEAQAILSNPGDHGIDRFLTEVSGSNARWRTGNAVLLRIEVVVPDQTVAWKLPEGTR